MEQLACKNVRLDTTIIKRVIYARLVIPLATFVKARVLQIALPALG